MNEFQFLLGRRAWFQPEEMLRKTVGLQAFSDRNQPLFTLRVIASGVVFEEQIVENDAGLNERLMHGWRVLTLP